MDEQSKSLLKKIPGVDHLLDVTRNLDTFNDVPLSIVTASIRRVLANLRNSILGGDNSIGPNDLTDNAIAAAVEKSVAEALAPNLKRVVNATGIVVHTNLGRSRLSAAAIANVDTIAGHYSNLEYDLTAGRRGLRYTAVEDVICHISGAESAMVVNNNAGAVLLALDTLCRGSEAIVSRGELVEIGGAFRIPEVMEKSGSVLKEVGTTNRTHLRDYENAINDNTALLMKVHQSNYSIIGFSAEVPLADLVALGQKHRIPVMEDLGSGTFIDFSNYGLQKEPTVQESVAAGVDVITFSGDKLLGGPQAGVIIGRKSLLDRIKKNPLTRALRIDKMTLASLESTMRQYFDPEKAVNTIPTLQMITLPYSEVKKRASRLKRKLMRIVDNRLQTTYLDRPSRAGGGSLPQLEIPSRCLSVHIPGISANRMEGYMRAFTPPIIGRIEDDQFLMDLRTVREDELIYIKAAIESILAKAAP